MAIYHYLIGLEKRLGITVVAMQQTKPSFAKKKELDCGQLTGIIKLTQKGGCSFHIRLKKRDMFVKAH